MASGLTVDAETTFSCVWILDSEERNYIQNFSEGGVVFGKTLDGERWQLQIQLAKTGSSREPSFGVFVKALPQADDFMKGNSWLAWTREEVVTIPFCHIISPVDPRTVVDGEKDGDEKDALNSINKRSGWTALAALSDVQRWLTQNGSLAIYIRFVTHGAQGTPTQIGDDTSALLHFDQPGNADLVFRFCLDNCSPRYIFATKEYLIDTCTYFETLFESGFAESTDSASLDLATLPASSSDDKSFTYDNTELRPFLELDPKTVETPAPRSPTLPPSQEAKEDPPRSAKRRKRNTQDAVGSEKKIQVIDIAATDFTTYRAMLAYLHTEMVPFTALPSDYLVDRQQALDHESEESDEIFTFPSPQTWFYDNFHNLYDQRDWNGIKPCSPHAMYRLADCYGIEHLRELARDRILRSLTVENVAYELFSPLSFDYDEIQQSVLDYINKNWAEVKETKALDIVLDKFASGDLPQARELIKKVWTRMAPEVTSVVNKSKKKK